ncbi:hypothetical protein [Deinococcus sp.]|uniref:hypothetical protein n=1 Tax=Deinococcus sp. TaxID=47478 RepID=UPI0025D53550|nr:hypothetical protein [Deinococcus sp.]
MYTQPYGWCDAGWNDQNGVHHTGPHIDNTIGELAFSYGWKFTNGSLADLGGIKIYEFLDYSGNPGTPLSALTWNISQKYEFDDPQTGEVGTVLYNPGNVVDAIRLNPNQFTVTKSTYTATKPL